MLKFKHEISLMKIYFTFLRKTLLYFAKLYYIKSIFSSKIETTKIPFSIQKLTIFFILIYVLEYQLNTKRHNYMIIELFH